MAPRPSAPRGFFPIGGLVAWAQAGEGRLPKRVQLGINL